ncbi:MAG: GtrA family protein [Candidatus Paceibacterota bacterium]|jgi:putative flippase GtrA
MLTRRDYWAVAFIGACFGLFAIPILQNVQISFISIGLGMIVGLIIFFAVFAVVALAVAAYLSRWFPAFLQIAKFAAVGAFNTFLDWGVLGMLTVFFGTTIGVGYALAKGTSFTISNVGSYFWNKYWTFDAGGASHVGREVVAFITVSVIGLVINVAISSVVVNVITPPDLFTPQRWGMVGAAVATLASLVWNFVGYKFIVFKPSDTQKTMV